MLAPTALTLGIIENLDKAKLLMETYPWKSWQLLRKEAARHTFHATLTNQSIVPVLTKLLSITKEGLLKRGLGEEIYLQTLFERLEKRQSPADFSIAVFKEQGFSNLLTHLAFQV